MPPRSSRFVSSTASLPSWVAPSKTWAPNSKCRPAIAKSYSAAVVRRIFGAKGFRTKILEFEEMGLTPRITRVRDDFMPYESLSFPAFRY